MNTLAGILWQTSEKHLRSAVENLCKDYETNPKYHLKKFFEKGELMGFCVYYDVVDFRVLEGGFYLGNNKTIFLKMWKFCTRGAKKMRALVHKTNYKIIDFFQKMKFKEISEDSCHYVFERGE